MDSFLHVLHLGIFLICFRLCCAAPRIAVPTLRSGDLIATDGRGRNGRSVEIDRWMEKDGHLLQQPTAPQQLEWALTSRPPPVPDVAKLNVVTVSKVGKRIWDTSSPTFEKETSSFSASAGDKQSNAILRERITQETSKLERSPTFPVVMRKVRLSSVSVDPKQAQLSSYPIVKLNSSIEKVPAVSKGTTTSKQLKPTRSPPTTSASKFNTTQSSGKTNGLVGSGGSSTNLFNPSTIILVPDREDPCRPGYKMDEDGDCREVFE